MQRLLARGVPEQRFALVTASLATRGKHGSIGREDHGFDFAMGALGAPRLLELIRRATTALSYPMSPSPGSDRRERN